MRSTLGELTRPDVIVEINPADAEVRHIEDRDEVRIFNDLGEVRLKAHVTHLVRPGTIVHAQRRVATAHVQRLDVECVGTGYPDRPRRGRVFQ